MNLFISDNFIDTIGNKVNVLQLIRQVAEDDEIIHSEVIGALREIYDYVSADMLDDDICQGEIEDCAMQDETLYVGGASLQHLFENLYPGDHTDVINALVNSLASATSPLVKLDHNCVPVVLETVEEKPDFMSLSTVTPVTFGPMAPAGSDANFGAPPVPAGRVKEAGINTNSVITRPVEPFPEKEEVQCSEMAVLNAQALLGSLEFNEHRIPVVLQTHTNGVLFDVEALYYRIYGLQLNAEYLQQLVTLNNGSIHTGDLRVISGRIHLSLNALAVIHSQVSPAVEWYPIVMKVTNLYANNPYRDVKFDLLGNQVG